MMGKHFSLCLILLFLSIGSASAAWYNGDWLYRIKLTIDAGQVNGDQTDFPVYVDLGDFNGTGLFANALSNGADLRVTKSDGTTEVPIELVFFDAGATNGGELHFKASGTLSGTSNSDWYLYYGNSGASAYADSTTYGAENVWNSNYAAVYHMQEDPSGSAPQMVDSTSNSYDGTSGGSMTSGDLVTGQLSGSALNFDGSNDEINIGTTPNWASTDALTWQCWSNTTNASAKSMIAKGINSSPFDGINMFLTSGDFRFSMVPTLGTPGQIFVSVTASYNDGAWRMYHASYDGSETAAGITPYVNGVTPSHSSSGTWSGSLGTTRNLKLGERDGGINWAGDLDEIRLSNVVLSSTWINTEYNNQNSSSTFYSVGTEETDTSGATFTPKVIFF